LIVSQESVPCVTLGNDKQCSHLPPIVPPRERNKELGNKTEQDWFYLPSIMVETSRRLFLRTHTLALLSAQRLNSLIQYFIVIFVLQDW